jgi:predicted Mrr-cat superfamily restriction endonuclease
MSDRRYWVMRTHVDARDQLLAALKKGELRQGWGYDERLDLNRIADRLEENGWRVSALDDEERATWRGNQRMWPGHWGRINPGDLIVLPKMPKDRHWMIVEVIGEYRYDLRRDLGDYGHVLPVKIRVHDISNANRAVSAGLQRTMRTQSRLWNIDALADDVGRLLDESSEIELSRADSSLERLEDVMEETIAFMREQLLKRFGGNQFEDPVFRLLERLYGQGRVFKRAGPREAGADYEINLVDPLGVASTIVVQLKTYQGTFNDLHALDQIETAVSQYNAAAAVILTTALREGDDFSQQREGRAAELGVPVRFVDGAELARLFIAHLGDLVTATG